MKDSGFLTFYIHSLKQTFSPPENGGFSIGISFPKGLFSGAMLVSGRVYFHEKIKGISAEFLKVRMFCSFEMAAFFRVDIC